MEKSRRLSFVPFNYGGDEIFLFDLSFLMGILDSNEWDSSFLMGILQSNEWDSSVPLNLLISDVTRRIRYGKTKRISSPFI